MRRLRKAMRSDAIARPPIKISRFSRVHPNSSAFAADVGRALSSAEFGRSAKTARSKKPGTIGAMRRLASDGRSGRGPSKDDKEDASEWSSPAMEVDMVFGESASFVCMGCSSIFALRHKRQRWFLPSAGAAPVRRGPSPALGRSCVVHKTRCGRNSCTCEPASRSCQDTRILFRPALCHASKDCYGSTATSTGALAPLPRASGRCQRRPVAAPPVRPTLPAPTFEALVKQPSHRSRLCTLPPP